MPDSTPLELRLTPLGNGPVSEKVGAGYPEVVTVKLPAAPAVKVVLPALVIAGACSTVSVKLCVALVPTPFEAVT